MRNGMSNVIESLESRRLLSVAVLAGHNLLVVGNGNAANSINVQLTSDTSQGNVFTSDSSQISVSITSTNARGVSKTLQKSFAAQLVSRIIVRGGSQADNIAVGQPGGPFNVATLIDAGGGNDSITIGDQSATVIGGAGDDTVVAGNGNDIVRGGVGNDSLTVGNGNDKVDGGAGNDVITAGTGNDTLSGGSGNDTITATDPAGNADLVYGGRGNDIISVGAGNDTVWGGVGDDTITAGNGNDTFGAIVGHNTVVAGSGHNTYFVHSLTGQTLSYDPSKDTLITKPNKAETATINL